MVHFLQRLATTLLLLIAAALFLSVTVFDMTELSQRLLGRFVPETTELGQKTPETTTFSASKIAAVQAIRRQVEAAVTEAETRRIITHLANLESRVVGYPGNKAAYTFVRDAFQALGLEDITTDTFQVTVPIDQGAQLTLLETGARVPLYAFWPNRVRTPTLPRGGVTGRLIYGGKGTWEELDGKPIDGNIVLLDFASAGHYLNARMLGAQVILFFDNGLVSRGEAEQKIEEVPLNVPRYWVKREDALPLLALAEEQPTVQVKGRMTWETVETWNVFGIIPGSAEPMPGQSGQQSPVRWRDKIVVVEAHYDAMSVVPALAPGAESASGIAALLQIARGLKAYNPGYTFVILATSGHFEALAGISDFLYHHARGSERFLKQIDPAERIPFDLFIGLDLSSGSDQLATFCYGLFANFDTQQEEAIRKRMVPYAKRLTGYAETLFGPAASNHYADAIIPTQRSWRDFLPTFLALDHEAVSRVGLKGISFVTPNDLRLAVDTPVDWPEQIRFDYLTTQIETAAGLLLALSRDPRAFEDVAVRIQDLGHNLQGRVVEWDRSIDFFTPKKPLPGAVVTFPGGWESYTGVRSLLVTQADEKGQFVFHNIPEIQTLEVRSYLLNEDGEIIYAPDQGEEGAGMFPLDVANRAAVNGCVQVLFACRSLDLMETVDPVSLRDLGSLTILGPDNSSLRKYGEDYAEEFGGRTAVAYAEPGTRIKALAGTGATSIQYLLTNPPEAMFLDPPRPAAISEKVRTLAQGQGYSVDQGLIRYPFFRSAQDLWVLDDVRLNGMIRHGVKNDRASKLHSEARVALLEARQALSQLNYSAFVAQSRKAWGLEVRAYPDIKGTADDTVRAVIFYFVLVLPFAYFMERLLFAFPDIRKQMAAFGGLFVLVFLVLQRVHPAFKLSMTPYIVFLAFVILALGVIVIFVLLAKFDWEMKRIKHQQAGLHETDIGRMSATGMAISLGISNLRKRKLRSTLTAVTLILLTFTVLSFTSYSTAIQFYKLSRPNEPTYQGAMIRDPSWRRLDQVLLDYLESAFATEAEIVPRSTWMSSLTDSRVDFQNSANGRKSFVTSLLGLSAKEPLVTGLDSLLIGPSRWFKPGERLVCILPTAVAKRIGIGPEELGEATIQMLGSTFQVIGLIDSDALDALRDLDDERITPVSFFTRGTQGSSSDFSGLINITTADHLASHNTMILPHGYLIEIDGSLRSVALIPKGTGAAGERRFYDSLQAVLPTEAASRFYDSLEGFLSRVSLAIFVGRNDSVMVYSSVGVTAVSGLENLAIPIIIAALLVLNTMMGAVHERFQEIGVYSAVGLAPSHIAALFFAEAVVFATIGVVLGYLLGQITTMALVQFNLLQGLALNYSSMSAVFSSLIVIAVVLLSVVYPAKKAAEMSVQDVSRRWELPEPQGDTWRFEFPFTVSGVEALAVCTYLARVFRAHEHGVAEGFVADNTALSEFSTNGHQGYRLEASTWLAPFDLGVSQWTVLEVVPTEGGSNIYRIDVTLQHKSGDLSSWINLNRGFLKVLRKRFLVWRTMGQALKDEYAQEGKMLVGKTT